MKSNAVKKVLLAASLSSAIAVVGSNALADDAATIFGLPSGTTVTYDDASGMFPVITAILSQPGTVNTRTYSSWAFLANDGTGSLEVYGTMPSGFTPAVGETISVSGTYSPYEQIPEIEDVTVASTEGTGTVPPVGISTIPTLNQSTLPQSIAGNLWTLDDVTISGISGNFGGSNLTGTITDSSDNSMELYYWVTSYSSANSNLNGTAIPTGPVDMTGFVSVYGSGPAQFTPISITSVPEPTSLALFSVGGLLVLALALRRRGVA
jgi:PEP-CTERM motif